MIPVLERGSRLSRFRAARSRGWLGIDVGAHALKLAVVERQAAAWRLQQTRIVPHAEPLAFDDPPKCAAQVLAGLDQAWEQSGRWLGDAAACALPLSAQTLRSLCLPAATQGELRAMIGQEFADETGIDAERWSVSWWQDETVDASPETVSLTAVGLATELAEAVLGGLLSRGLECRIMAASPLLLARAAALDSRTGGGQPIGVLDWGYQTALFTVAASGRPMFTRVLRDCGFRHVIESVAKALQLNPRDVPYLLCRAQRTATADGPRPPRPVIEELVDGATARLRAEILRTLAHVRCQRADMAPRQLLVCGGGATLDGVAEQLSAATQVPTSVWKVPNGDWLGELSGPPVSSLAAAAALSAWRWTT